MLVVLSTDSWNAVAEYDSSWNEVVGDGLLIPEAANA